MRTDTLDAADVPAVITQAEIEQYQHVNRLYEQEPDLYTVIFQNRDGSKTVYLFGSPVKYVDETECNEWIRCFFQYFEEFYQDTAKNFLHVCMETDSAMQLRKNYHVVEDGEIVVSVKNYVIVGNRSFP